MELLARLLGGVERVKIMRFFLHHGDIILSLTEIAHKTKSKATIVRKELNALTSVGFIEKKKSKMAITTGAGKKVYSKVKEVSGYALNPLFPHNDALKDLLFDFHLFDKKKLVSLFKNIGRTKMFIVSGIFLGEIKSRVDILIVGEAIKQQKAEKILEQLSAELGRDVVCSIMDVEEYEYRYKMYDKFVLDILSLPHEKVINKLKEKTLS